jgi:hypothetical protein
VLYHQYQKLSTCCLLNAGLLVCQHIILSHKLIHGRPRITVWPWRDRDVPANVFFYLQYFLVRCCSMTPRVQTWSRPHLKHFHTNAVIGSASSRLFSCTCTIIFLTFRESKPMPMLCGFFPKPYHFGKPEHKMDSLEEFTNTKLFATAINSSGLVSEGATAMAAPWPNYQAPWTTQPLWRFHEPNRQRMEASAVARVCGVAKRVTSSWTFWENFISRWSSQICQICQNGRGLDHATMLIFLLFASSRILPPPHDHMSQ